MKTLIELTRRNIKLFFRDKGMFFTSLITPLILLVLYVTFLGNVYRDSFLAILPEELSLSDTLVSGCVAGQLVSSLLAVCCVTVSFCSNMLMVQDKVTGARADLTVTPVKRSTLALSYYLAAALSSLIICLIAAGAGFLYLSFCGWYLSFGDLLRILLDVFLLVMFGTALSSVISHFLSSQGQISAVGTIVSSGYGFLCGAYMPISQFGSGLQKLLSFLPGTYGTVLLRDHAMRGALSEMAKQGVPEELIQGIRDSFDCNLYFFDSKVTEGTMYLVLISTVLLLIGAYILIHYLGSGKPSRR